TVKACLDSARLCTLYGRPFSPTIRIRRSLISGGAVCVFLRFNRVSYSREPAIGGALERQRTATSLAQNLPSRKQISRSHRQAPPPARQAFDARVWVWSFVFICSF